jgi:hypothetical protein
VGLSWFHGPPRLAHLRAVAGGGLGVSAWEGRDIFWREMMGKGFEIDSYYVIYTLYIYNDLYIYNEIYIYIIYILYTIYIHIYIHM